MKSFIIAKANLRKFKGLSICLTALILIASMFITLLGLLQTDFKSNIRKNSESLNTTDALIYSSASKYISEEDIMSTFEDDILEYKYQNAIITTIFSKYNHSDATNSVFIENLSAFNRDLSQVEIVKENKSITSNYIYLPYQFHTGGKINIGDDYDIKVGEVTYNFKIRGFINSTYGGCNNMGIVEIVASNEVYEQIKSDNFDFQSFMIYLNYKNKDNLDERINKYIRDVRLNKGYELTYSTNELIVANRGFMGDIFFVMFLIVALVIIAIALLSIFNNINNYLRENLKTLGVLKAIGYTSNDIRKAIIMQFSIIMFLGTILGIIAGYLFIPVISGILVSQSGLPYSVSFSFVSTLLPLIILPMFIYLIIFVAVIKVKKIEAVNALRNSNNQNTIQRNHFSLAKSKFSLNISIGLKNMMNSLKQNIVSFIVLIFVSLSLVTAVTFYENFDRNPKINMFTLEYCEAAAVVENYNNDEIYNALLSDDRVSNLRRAYDAQIIDYNYQSMWCFAVDNMDNYQNKEVCYKGRLPYADDEIMISGIYAKAKNLKIGDTIYLSSFSEFNYKITGFSQTTNNGGSECVMSLDALRRIEDVHDEYYTYYFEVSGDERKLINEYKEIYGDKIVETIIFQDVIDSAMGTFKALSKSLLAIIFIISIIDISLVIYILLRTLIYKRRFEYGILKAMGFTSKELILQNILAFSPLIIIGAVLGTIFSYFVMNPVFSVGMRSFGIMKCNLNLPMDLIVISPIIIIILSIMVITLMSLKIRKIEPYKLLIAE